MRAEEFYYYVNDIMTLSCLITFLSCFSYGFCICFWLCICHCVSIRSTHYSDQDHKYLKSPIEGLVIVLDMDKTIEAAELRNVIDIKIKRLG